MTVMGYCTTQRSMWNKLWLMRHEFIKYFVIGFSAFLLDVGSLYLLKQYVGLKAYAAVMVNQPFMLLYVFYLNKLWSFKTEGLTHKQMIRFVTVAGMNYLISALWMWTLSEKLGLQYLLARTLNVGLAVGWNFLLYKYWVYAAEAVGSSEAVGTKL